MAKVSRQATRETHAAHRIPRIMTLIDLLTSPWAIDPAKLLEIQSIYSTHLKGEKIDLEAVEQRLGRPLANEQQAYEVRDGGIAVLPISGVMAPKANLFTRVSGGASADMLAKQVASMQADHRVRGAVLDIDSPGGSVFGTPALAEAVRALAAAKPTASVSTGTMASALYWVGSAANAVYASGATDAIGSIGVVATHSYNPRATGAQVTEITAGKFKRMASDSAPLTAEGRAYLQQQVDHLYSVFVQAVAENRRVPVDQVLERMADGRVFIGSQAQDAGLIDGIATVDTIVERMATDPTKFAQRRKAVFALGGVPGAQAADTGAAILGEAPGAALATTAEAPPLAAEAKQTGPVLPEATNQPHEAHMTPEQFKAAHPEAYAAILSAGATAERDRIKAVREQSMPGHEALIDQLAMDGKTTGPEAAVAVLAAERARAAGVASARAADAPPPVATADEPRGSQEAAKPARIPNAAAAYAAMNRARA